MFEVILMVKITNYWLNVMTISIIVSLWWQYRIWLFGIQLRQRDVDNLWRLQHLPSMWCLRVARRSLWLCILIQNPLIRQRFSRLFQLGLHKWVLKPPTKPSGSWIAIRGCYTQTKHCWYMPQKITKFGNSSPTLLYTCQGCPIKPVNFFSTHCQCQCRPVNFFQSFLRAKHLKKIY